MSRSDWGFRIALILVAAIGILSLAGGTYGLLLGDYSRLHEANSRYQLAREKDLRQAAQEADEACSRVERPKRIDCIGEKIEAYRAQQSAKEDLQVQKDMAYWAKWMFFATLAGVSATAVGVYLVALTLGATKGLLTEAEQATAAAKDAAVAANEANTVMYAAHVAERRAWIKITSARMTLTSVDGGALTLHTIIRYKNIGNSPATGVSVRHTIIDFKEDYGPVGPETTKLLVEKRERDVRITSTVLPGEYDQMVQIGSVGKTLLKIINGEDKLGTAKMLVSVVYVPYANCPPERTSIVCMVNITNPDVRLRDDDPPKIEVRPQNFSLLMT